MVKYTISALQAMVGAKPTVPIDKIHEQPTFSNLWHLQLQLVEGLQKLGNIQFLIDSHAGYILSTESFSLLSRKEWRDPEEVGDYYKNIRH